MRENTKDNAIDSTDKPSKIVTAPLFCPTDFGMIFGVT